MYLAGLDEILEMQDEISDQLTFLERNATEAREVLDMLKAGRLDDKTGQDVVDALEERLLGKLAKLQEGFKKQVAEITAVSRSSIDTFRKLVEGKDEAAKAAQQNNAGGAAKDGNKGGAGEAPGAPVWIVKWHNNGINTSPRFVSEAQAYRYFVNVGNYAKKLVAYDGRMWMTVKTYGGRQWTDQLTDDGSYQGRIHN